MSVLKKVCGAFASVRSGPPLQQELGRAACQDPTGQGMQLHVPLVASFRRCPRATWRALSAPPNCSRSGLRWHKVSCARGCYVVRARS